MPHPTQINSGLGKAYFPKKAQKHTTPQNHKTDPHFFSAPTQPNSTKFSMQHYFNPTRRLMQKNQVNPPPPFQIYKKKIFNQARPNSVCNLISEDSLKKMGHLFDKTSTLFLQVQVGNQG